MNELKYKIIRTARKTVAIQIKPDKTVIVRAPKRMSKEQIHSLVQSKEKWIQKHLQELENHSEEDCQPLSEEDLKALADKAVRIIPERVRYYAPLIGVTYGKITIRNQRTRWGSCSSKGNLNFNCLLMLAPPEVLDSVVVHELCHRKEMNHSKQFYEEVRRVFPEYDKWNGWLKTYGPDLMKRMTSKEP